MIQRARLAASLLLLAAFLPTTVAASEGPAVIATINLGPNTEATAFALAVNPNTNKTYVTPGWETLGCESHIVSVIDNSTNTVLAPITVGLSPFGVAVNPKTNRIYVANIGGALCTEESSNSVSVIDGSTDTVVATFSIGSEARAIAFDSNGRFLYVAARNTNQLAVVDARTNAVVQTVPVGRRPHGVVFNPDNGRIYVTNRGSCD